MESETSVDMSSFIIQVDQQAAPRTKRKLLEEIDSTDNACLKRLNNEDYLSTGNWRLSTAVEVVNLNEQTISLNTAEFKWIKIQIIDMNESCTSRNENNTIEITLQNTASIFKEISVSGTCMDSNSDFSKCIKLSEHSVTEFKHNDDTDDFCNNDLSWLINFKTNALSNAAEVEHSHKNKGGKEEETAYLGMCYKYLFIECALFFAFCIKLPHSIISFGQLRFS